MIVECAPDDPRLVALMDEMTAELIVIYSQPPDAGPAPRCLLALVDGAPVGCCAVSLVSPGLYELKRMYVRPASRGTGVAVRLLARAEELASGRMRLDTGVLQPAAIRLYERAGYRRVENWPPHDRDPDAVCYVKDLDFWDRQAATFDEEPDHGLRDPSVREAWARLLLPLLPPAPASVTDLGCGTGSLAVLMAEAGHDVRGVDLSAEMVSAAVRKAEAAGLAVEFVQGDAAEPPGAPASCDVVLSRHVLWTLPDPAAALGRWVRLLKPGGLLVLVEGHWSTGAGLTAAECEALVLTVRQEAVVRRLDDPALWGRRIDDERYLLVSRG